MPRRRFKRRFRRRYSRRRRVVVDPELKTRDMRIEALAFLGSPIIAPLSQLDQGFDEDDRIGTQALFRSFQVRVSATLGSSGTSQLRFMLLLDKMPDGNLLTAPEILVDDGVPIVSALNLQNNKRLRVLWTKVFTWSAGTVVQKYFQVYKKMYLPVRYGGQGDQASAVRSNQLYWCVFGASDMTTSPQLTMYIRQRFVG